MENIKLKYLILGIISLSILMIAGAILFNLLQDYKKSTALKQQTNNSLKPSPGAKPPVQNSKIRIVYPSGNATRSARFKAASAPGTPTASGSASGTGSIPKSIPKP